MQVAPKADLKALGEQFGFDVPTRYSEETHTLFNQIMAADCTLTPFITRMSPLTVWVCRGLSALLVYTSAKNDDMSLRQRLQIEAAVGIAMVIAGLLNIPRLRFLERLYWIMGGVMMVGNAIMTQTESD